VEDDGPGISKEDINYIFDRYYTGKSDERKNGSGLGLMFAENLLKCTAEKFRWKVKLISIHCFIIKLPLKFQGNESK
jgi:signal transduction histidine kinase